MKHIKKISRTAMLNIDGDIHCECDGNIENVILGCLSNSSRDFIKKYRKDFLGDEDYNSDEFKSSNFGLVLFYNLEFSDTISLNIDIEIDRNKIGKPELNSIVIDDSDSSSTYCGLNDFLHKFKVIDYFIKEKIIPATFDEFETLVRITPKGNKYK